MILIPRVFISKKLINMDRKAENKLSRRRDIESRIKESFGTIGTKIPKPPKPPSHASKKDRESNNPRKPDVSVQKDNNKVSLKRALSTHNMELNERGHLPRKQIFSRSDSSLKRISPKKVINLEDAGRKQIQCLFSHSVYAVNCVPLGLLGANLNKKQVIKSSSHLNKSHASKNYSPQIKRSSASGQNSNNSIMAKYLREGYSAAKNEKQTSIERKSKPSFQGADQDEGTPSTIPTTRPISCEEKKMAKVKSSLGFTKKPNLGWLESTPNQIPVKKHFLDKGKATALIDNLTEWTHNQKDRSSFLRNSVPRERGSFKQEKRSTLQRLSSFEGGQLPATNRLSYTSQKKLTGDKVESSNSVLDTLKSKKSYPVQIETLFKSRKMISLVRKEETSEKQFREDKRILL